MQLKHIRLWTTAEALAEGQEVQKGHFSSPCRGVRGLPPEDKILGTPVGDGIA